MSLFTEIIKITADFVGTVMKWLYHSGEKPFSELSKEENKRLIGTITILLISMVYIAIRY